MTLTVTSIEDTTPLPDQLAFVRSEQKRLRKIEEGLSDRIMADRDVRVGVRHHPVVSDRVRSTTNWEALALSLNPPPGQIKAFTTESASQEVDVYQMPPTEELIELLQGRLTVVDCETTGLSSTTERLVSLTALPLMLHPSQDDPTGPLRPHFGNSAAWVVNPGKPLNSRTAAVNGFNDAELSKLKPFNFDVGMEVLRFIKKDALVAHNAPLNKGFINAQLDRIGLRSLSNVFIDTRLISKKIWPGANASLDAMCERLGVVRTGRLAGVHDALGDCHLLARCLPGLLAKLKELV